MKWEKILIALVSAVFAVILYILLPIESNKYRLKLVGDKVNFKLVARAFQDMDGDGESEIIRYKNGNPVPAITLERANGEIVNQWNLNGDWIESTKGLFADTDHDGFTEIVTLTYFQDSIWLHLIEPLQKKGTFLHIPVDRVEMYNDHQDWLINFGTPQDLNGDGWDDIFFSIRAGFTLRPRKLYVLDGKTEELMVQEMTLGNNVAWPLCLDLDQDGVMEITGKVSAPGNLANQETIISDTCAWLLIYDQKLQFKSEPVSYPGSPAYLKVLALKKDRRQLLVSCYHTKTQTGIFNRVEVWEWLNDSLQVITCKELLSEQQVELISIDQQREGVFALADGHQIIWLDETLQEKGRLTVEGSFYPEIYYPMDVNGDGLSEHIFITDLSKLHILQSDFRHGIELDLGYNESSPLISPFTKDHTHYINVYRGNQNILLAYSRNPFYPFRFLILLFSFCAYYLIFSFITNLQRKRIEKRLASERQILHYQLTNVMQQLDPHFLFNALSNISSFYHKGDQEHAQSYLAKVSRLVRTTLENSERMTITLKEEMAFVADYLSVEQIRMGDRLNYSIELDDVLQQKIQIPKMLIQNFVENAVKHGIRHLTDRPGLIRIYSEVAETYLHLVVEDNGVGRKSAAELQSFGTGSGLHMIEKSLQIFEKLEKIKIDFEIKDLKGEDGLPKGTIVSVRIPI